MVVVMGLIAIPLMLLNLFSGLVAGVWLLALGKWGIALAGLLYALAGTFVISVAMLPGLMFAGPAALAAKRGHTGLAAVLGLPSLVWTYLLLFGSCFYFVAYAARIHDGPVFPYLLWAYATALAPWSYMARKEQETGNEYGLYSVSGAQLGTLLMGVGLLIDPHDYSFVRLSVWMAPGLVFAMLLQGMQIWASTRECRG